MGRVCDAFSQPPGSNRSPCGENAGEIIGRAYLYSLWTRLVIVSVEGAYNILYFHFDVIAFDHDFVTWNAILRWRPQNSAGFQVEIRTMPRTGDPGALNVAFRKGSATVRAGVADGIVSSLQIEEGYFLAFDCERSRLAGWHVVGLSYLEKFCHNA